MKSIQPEFITTIRALQEAVSRLDTILQKIPLAENAGEDYKLARILRDSGKEAIGVAYNALETFSEFGIDYSQNESDGESGTFNAAFALLKAGSLEPKRQVA